MGVIKVGYLIKFIPKTSKLPTKRDLSHPLVGFDVYRMVADEDKPAFYYQWRYGQGDPGYLNLEAEVLGRGRGGDVSIPLKRIVNGLVKRGVTFLEPDEN